MACGSPSSVSAIKTEILSAHLSTAVHQVGHNIFVNRVSTWRSLSSTTRSLILGRLAVEEETFTKAAKAGDFSHNVRRPHRSQSVRPLMRSPNPSESDLRAGSGAFSSKDPSYGFGGSSPFTTASTAAPALNTLTHAWLPCVSDRSLLVCGGTVASSKPYDSDVLGEGLSASNVDVEGYAAGDAIEVLGVTVPASDLPDSDDTVSITLNVFSVNVSNSCDFCIGAGGSPSYIYAASTYGSFTPSDEQTVAGPLSSLSLSLPGIDSIADGLSVGKAGYRALRTVLTTSQNSGSMGACGILTGASFAQSVFAAAGLLAASRIQSVVCQKTSFNWTGMVTQGQPLSFEVEPSAYAVDFGFGVISSSLFGLSSADVTVRPEPSPTTATTSSDRRLCGRGRAKPCQTSKREDAGRSRSTQVRQVGSDICEC